MYEEAGYEAPFILIKQNCEIKELFCPKLLFIYNLVHSNPIQLLSVSFVSQTS